MGIPIKVESLMPYRLGQSVFKNFELNKAIHIIGLVKDEKHPTGYAHEKWNKIEAHVVEIEIDGNTSYVALPIILNCVQNREGVIKNPGNKDLECIDNNKTLLEDMTAIYPGGVICFPEKITCIRKIKRGKYTSKGFVPLQFQKDDGTFKTLDTYIIELVEWSKLK